MKTYKNLFPQIYSFANLYAAFHKARQGKRYPDQYTKNHSSHPAYNKR